MKYTIVIDWLKLLCVGTIKQLENTTDESVVLINADLCLKRNTTNKNPGFHNCFDIIYKKEDFGLLYHATTGKYQYQHKNTTLISVNNHKLYEKHFSIKLRSIIDDLGIRFLKFTELHIAIDSLDLVNQHYRLKQNLNLVRKQKIKVSTEDDERKTRIIGFVLGSRKSDKYLTIYRKNVELLGADHKPYIIDFWESNKLVGLESENVDRLEIRFKKAKQLDDFDNDFSKLESTSYLADFFKAHGGNYITFANKKTKKEKSLIDWDSFSTSNYIKAKKVKHKPVKVATMTAIKVFIQQFGKTKKKIFLNAAVELSDQNKLNDKVAARVKRWIDDG